MYELLGGKALGGGVSVSAPYYAQVLESAPAGQRPGGMLRCATTVTPRSPRTRG